MTNQTVPQPEPACKVNPTCAYDPPSAWSRPDQYPNRPPPGAKVEEFRIVFEALRDQRPLVPSDRFILDGWLDWEEHATTVVAPGNDRLRNARVLKWLMKWQSRAKPWFADTPVAFFYKTTAALAREAQISERSVERALADLVDAELVIVRKARHYGVVRRHFALDGDAALAWWGRQTYGALQDPECPAVPTPDAMWPRPVELDALEDYQDLLAPQGLGRARAAAEAQSCRRITLITRADNKHAEQVLEHRKAERAAKRAAEAVSA